MRAFAIALLVVVAGCQQDESSAPITENRFEKFKLENVGTDGADGTVQAQPAFSAPPQKFRSAMTAPTAATGERNRARIVEGGHTVVGGLEKEIIRRVVRVNLNQVRYCFEKQLTKDPRLAGKLVLKWVVEPDGTVGAVTVQKTTFANEALSSCITSRVRRWRFPKPEGGGTVTVTYPFNFSPK